MWRFLFDNFFFCLLFGFHFAGNYDFENGLAESGGLETGRDPRAARWPRRCTCRWISLSRSLRPRGWLSSHAPSRIEPLPAWCAAQRYSYNYIASRYTSSNGDLLRCSERVQERTILPSSSLYLSFYLVQPGDSSPEVARLLRERRSLLGEYPTIFFSFTFFILLYSSSSLSLCVFSLAYAILLRTSLTRGMGGGRGRGGGGRLYENTAIEIRIADAPAQSFYSS